MQDVRAQHSTAARQRLEDAVKELSMVDVQMETEDEVDSLVNAFAHDVQVETEARLNNSLNKYEDTSKTSDVAQRQKSDFEQYTERLKTASAQIIVETTRKEYEKYPIIIRSM